VVEICAGVERLVELPGVGTSSRGWLLQLVVDGPSVTDWQDTSTKIERDLCFDECLWWSRRCEMKQGVRPRASALWWSGCRRLFAAWCVVSGLLLKMKLEMKLSVCLGGTTKTLGVPTNNSGVATSSQAVEENCRV